MINHDKSKFTDAIDMNDDEHQILEDKVKVVLKEILKKDCKLSNVYDLVQKTFSYKELVFCTTQHMYDLYKRYKVHVDEQKFLESFLDELKNL
tara:strand:+ start:10238 stop:10516 length:279 start_codon:yes stop_codon:yes gene_type:complete